MKVLLRELCDLRDHRDGSSTVFMTWLVMPQLLPRQASCRIVGLSARLAAGATDEPPDRSPGRARRSSGTPSRGGGAARGDARRAHRLARRRQAPSDRRARHGVDGSCCSRGGRFERWADVVRRARTAQDDVAFDFQGLMKSAVLARASGAVRVAGFSIGISARRAPGPSRLGDGRQAADEVGTSSKRIFDLLRTWWASRRRASSFRSRSGVTRARRGAPGARGGRASRFSTPARRGRTSAGRRRALATWRRFFARCAGCRRSSLRARRAGARAGGRRRLERRARSAPPTAVPDLVALSRQAALIVSGDTGPLHIAAAVGTPVVALFGPTDAGRNGPWAPDDVTVSRVEGCGCHYDRRCHEAAWCLESIGVAEVTAAIQQRLGRNVSPPSIPERSPRDD